MNGPLFITGTYRAGTTWISLLLQNHPEISVGLHTTNFFREDHGSGKYVTGKHDGECDFCPYYSALEYARQRWGLTPDEGKQKIPVSLHPTESECWDFAMRSLFDTDRWAEKQQLETGNIPTFLGWFPDGQALQIVRDPRSVLASWARYTHHDSPAEYQAAFVCLSSMQAALEYLEDLPDERHHLARYENVARHPEKQLRRLVDWLDLDWPGDEVMLSTEGWEDVPGSRWQDRSSFGRVDEGFDVNAAIMRWVDHLSDPEVAFVEHVCWKEMQAFGYRPRHHGRPYTFQFHEIIEAMREDGRTWEMWGRFRETGEGTEAFPSDPTDERNWTENVEATA